MSLPTCRVRVVVFDSAGGAPVVDATIIATLSSYEVMVDGYVVPHQVQVTTDANGEAFLDLFPNQLGSVESTYDVRIVSPLGKSLRVQAVVPNAAEADMHEIATLPPYEGQQDGSIILRQVLDARSQVYDARDIAINKAEQAQTAATLATNKAAAASTSASSASTSATNAATSSFAAAASEASAASNAGISATGASASQSYAVQAGVSAASAANSLAAALIGGAIKADSSWVANSSTAWVQPNSVDGYINFNCISKSAAGVITIIGSVPTMTALEAAKIIALIAAENDSDQFDYFVDAAIGSDSNPGTSKMRPFATLAAITALTLPTKARIGIARGSKYYSRLASAANRILVAAYGTGDDPDIDCSDACGAFTLTAGETVVYQTTLALPGGAGDKHKGNVFAGLNALKQVSSLAACRSTPGSVYVNDWTGTTATAYVHTATNVAPGADGLEYRYTARPNGIDLTGTECTVRGIKAGRNLHQDGSIRVAGEYGLTAWCTTYDGARHCMLHSATGKADFCNFIDGYNDLEGSADGLVFYSDAVVGKTARTNWCVFQAIRSTNFLGSIAHGQVATDLLAKIVHQSPTFIGPLVGTVTMSAVDSQLLAPIYVGVIGGMTAGKAGVVGQVARAKGTINNHLTFQKGAAATSANNVLTVPKLTKGLYYSNVTDGDAAATIVGDAVTIVDGKDLPTTPNADLISIARGSLAGGAGFVVGPPIACPIINGIYGGYGGSFVDNSDGIVWPIGTKFQIGATVYEDLPSYQAATGKQPHSSVAAKPSSAFSDDFSRSDRYIDADGNWALRAGAANTVAIRSNKLATTSGSAALYSLGGLLNADHGIDLVVASVPASGGPFFVLRATDQNNFIGVRVATGIIQLYKFVGGVATLVQNITRTVVVGDELGLWVRGSNVYVLHNLVAVLPGSFSKAITDAVLQTGRYAGIRPNGSALNPMASVVRTYNL